MPQTNPTRSSQSRVARLIDRAKRQPGGRNVYGLMKMISNPRASWESIVRSHLARDDVFIRQTCWHHGTLPRLPLTDVVPEARLCDVTLPRALSRKSGTSISAEEACQLASIAKGRMVRRALEIGTFDGNTALVLAANMAPDGEVVTVDLPPDFSMQEQSSLAFPDVGLNLTERDQVGRQFQGHELSKRIRQVYGDSAALDWSAFGGPFDLIFIDGCHAKAYVRSDSDNAFRQLAPGGIVVWHDYGMIADVSEVVDQLAREHPAMKFLAIEGTRLAVAVT
jgi:predicted O-methyltransferase YrrM